jgi:lysosomal Pro-X carboxypeptidase
MTHSLALQLGALVIVGEHRYFGKSKPFGNNSWDKENLGFLTLENVLMDYTALLKGIKQ